MHESVLPTNRTKTSFAHIRVSMVWKAFDVVENCCFHLMNGCQIYYSLQRNVRTESIYTKHLHKNMNMEGTDQVCWCHLLLRIDILALLPILSPEVVKHNIQLPFEPCTQR